MIILRRKGEEIVDFQQVGEELMESIQDEFPLAQPDNLLTPCIESTAFKVQSQMAIEATAETSKLKATLAIYVSKVSGENNGVKMLDKLHKTLMENLNSKKSTR